jgi:hypothetical protein
MDDPAITLRKTALVAPQVRLHRIHDMALKASPFIKKDLWTVSGELDVQGTADFGIRGVGNLGFSYYTVNCLEESLSWESTGRTVNQNILCLLRNPKCYYRVHKTLPLVHTHS